MELPTIEPRAIEFLEHAEAEALYVAIERLPDPKWRTLTEAGTEVGLRPGELYAVHGHRVDWLRGKVQVIDVMAWKGLRHHPKSARSHRTLPVPPHVLEGMSLLMTGRNWRMPCSCPLVDDSPADRARKSASRCPGLVFTAPEGGPVTDGHFRDASGTQPVRRPGAAASGREG
jgi:integrase